MKLTRKLTKKIILQSFPGLYESSVYQRGKSPNLTFFNIAVGGQYVVQYHCIDLNDMIKYKSFDLMYNI